ncbi:PAS domain S-box protein [Massilia forsythiae]|uniref:histidine kinase n=1 Tax=Massilia forsythiae TaxID=2728020 RepID=A0A7Z2VZY7_9BURK|nr:PAS domain S-box protein [Massilia forsythiae]QJE02204.1 PAS domain S-box protein [Massilia forsythiae]
MDGTQDDATFLAQRGPMAERIRTHDWRAHPLGDPAGWPPALRHALGMVLDSAFPTVVGWGEDLFTFFNEAYRAELGARADAALGRPLREVWRETWDEVAPQARRVLDGASIFREEVPATIERHGHPERAWFTFSFSPLRDDAGAVRGVVCTVIEVTARVQALARHQDAEQHLALALEASGTVGTWSYDLDTFEGRLDERLKRLFKVDGDLERSSAALARMVQAIAPEDRQRVLDAVQATTAAGAPYDIDYRIPQDDGGAVWVNARGKVFTDPLGRRRFAGIVADIGARKAAERAVLDSEARFRLIAEMIPQMVWSTDADGVNDYVNGRWQEFTGIPAAELLGDGWQRAIHPDDLPGVLRAWRAALGGAGMYELEHRLLHCSGAYRWVLNRGLPVNGADGRARRWMGTLTDIHDQKTGEEALRDEARRKDEFLAMLAHELRNPLAPISSAAQLLALAGADARRVRHASEVITRQVAHMTELVDDLLDVSRVTRGLVELARERIGLDGVVAAAVEQARPLIEARRHALRLHLGDGGALVDGDRTRLVQVLSNLLNNAAKYSPPGGSIDLSTSVADGQVRIDVRDDGIGIGAGMLPHVFDLFTQAERTPDRAQGGLGLGLALVRSLVQLHGGRVEAHSAGSGRGSTFSVALPLAGDAPAPPHASAAAAPVAEEAAAPALAALQGRGRRILVVDDNLDAAASLAGILAALGHAPATAAGSREALALAAAMAPPPEVFILDIGLPDIDGYELARRLRATAAPDGPPPLYLALSGYGQAHDRALSRSAGFDHHFVKPVDLAALLRVIDGGD